MGFEVWGLGLIYGILGFEVWGLVGKRTITCCCVCFDDGEVATRSAPANKSAPGPVFFLRMGSGR